MVDATPVGSEPAERRSLSTGKAVKGPVADRITSDFLDEGGYFDMPIQVGDTRDRNLAARLSR